MNAGTYELTARYDSRKAFYGKATVKVDPLDGSIHLVSYSTRVATITKDNELKIYGFYSATTLRHIKEFAAQHGFGYMTKNELRDYLVGRE